MPSFETQFQNNEHVHNKVPIISKKTMLSLVSYPCLQDSQHLLQGQYTFNSYDLCLSFYFKVGLLFC